MLSLLCMLYRARGYIPQNRLEVYRECADLLFRRWDSLRHIEQPFDHRRFGLHLMQELARFYYTSQAAQSGVEEGQLLRIISQFLQDVAGIEPSEADGRSRAFLDFCADRAWLLTIKGSNDRGVRLFGFTHRTFMEYFAAEAIVRRADGVEEIAQEVIRAFDRDPSSVITDVIVQSADVKTYRGAEEVLNELLRVGREQRKLSDKYLALCLRILNCSPVSGKVTRRLIKSVIDFWNQELAIDGTSQSSLALFSLYRDPREHVVALLEDP